MANIVELKEVCAKKVDRVTELQRALKTKLILRDFSLLIKEIPERLIKTGNKYVLDDKITICIDNNGDLNITDRRATAFGWLFELEFGELFVGDCFIHGNKHYSVRHLKENEFEGVCDEIQNVIAKIDESILRLTTQTDLNMWSYKYYDCHEAVTCNTLNEVLSTVVGRTPVFR